MLCERWCGTSLGSRRNYNRDLRDPGGIAHCDCRFKSVDRLPGAEYKHPSLGTHSRNQRCGLPSALASSSVSTTSLRSIQIRAHPFYPGSITFFQHRLRAGLIRFSINVNANFANFGSRALFHLGGETSRQGYGQSPEQCYQVMGCLR